MSKIRFVGLDVHADTIVVAVVEPSGEVHSHGPIPNGLESIRKMVEKLGPAEDLKPVTKRVPPATFCSGSRPISEDQLKPNLWARSCDISLPEHPLAKRTYRTYCYF
jgi:hypothetical protein